MEFSGSAFIPPTPLGRQDVQDHSSGCSVHFVFQRSSIPKRIAHQSSPIGKCSGSAHGSPCFHPNTIGAWRQ
ncbi:hypothetical protein TNCV_4591331 [Trichonephila clavipes]|nr:hypothetical protein TNCV_4591331 [Trichonephila clavipes]